MSKKRIMVLLVLNMLLLVTALYAMVNLYFLPDGTIDFDFAKLIITDAEFACPLLVIVVTLLYILALIHAFNYKGKVPKFFDAIRLMVIVAQLLIALVEYTLFTPYRGEFTTFDFEYYIYIAIPLLSFIAFIPTKKKYSAFALLYSLIPLAIYLTTIISLAAFNVIDLPYQFLDIFNQHAYKSAINFAILVAGNTLIASLLMIISYPGKLETC